VLAYCGSAAPLLSLHSFYNYARGHCEAARNFFRVVHTVVLISVEHQNHVRPRCVVRELFWGMLGRGDGGLRSIGVSGSGYNEILALEVLNVIDCVERKRRAGLPASASAPCAVAAAPSFQVCLCACICTFCTCVYICVCVYVCGHVYMHIYACVYVYVYVCIYTHVYVYVYAYLCIDCGSQYQCFGVWTVSCMPMRILVHMYAYA